MYTYSVYYPLCLQCLNSEKNSQFEIMKFDNSNISLKYFHLMYIFKNKSWFACFFLRLTLTWVTGVIDGLGLDLIPYIVLLVVQVLRRMSDQNEAVRLMATACFASLIRLMPLEVGISYSLLPNFCDLVGEPHQRINNCSNLLNSVLVDH